MRLSALAPAKVNRELRVGRLRPDGYHEILSRMASIDLADRLTGEPSASLELTCDNPAVPLGEENLVTRAAVLLARHAGVEPRARLHLEKRVPMGGGLGGGSADAAVALILLDRLWRLETDASSLTAMAAELGSDAPFFLCGGEADATGRGQSVTPVEPGPTRDLLLLVPPFSISTAGVYGAYAGRGTLPARLEVEDPVYREYFGPNDLTPAVLIMEPRMDGYLASAARVTPDFVVSGSGSTIALHGAGPDAAAWLEQRHPEARVFRCRTLSREDYRERTNPVEA